MIVINQLYIIWLGIFTYVNVFSFLQTLNKIWTLCKENLKSKGKVRTVTC